VSLYAAYRAGWDNPLPPRASQYRDYVLDQQQRLHGEALARQLDFWEGHLRGAPDLLDLPADRPRPAVQSYRGARHEFALGAELTIAVRALSSRCGVTPYMVLWSGWALTLARLSGATEVVIGAPVANRLSTATERMIGLFVNTLALRTDLRGESTVQELLKRVRKMMLAGWAHQECPFEQVVARLQPPRSLSHSPIFQVSFVLQNTPQKQWRLPGLTLTPLSLPNDAAQWDLSLAMLESAGEMVGALNYATDLFDASTIERWVGYFKHVLAAMARNPERPVREVRLTADPGRVRSLGNRHAAKPRAALTRWNDTDTAWDSTRSVHALFEARVLTHPHACAVRFEDQQLSYAQLNARANQLAHTLIARGIGPDMAVAVCLPRSPQMLIALLGILKAGAAYLPIDPDHPQERIRFILQDAHPALLICTPRIQQQLVEHSAQSLVVQPFDLHASGPSIPDHNPELPLHPRQLAYIIYTSGSTGAPQGVMVPHANLTHLFAATERWYRFDEHDVWALCHSFAVDFSIWEIGGALIHGGALVLVPFETTRSARALLDLLRRERVTVLNSLPSAFEQLVATLAEEPAAQLSSLRWIILGGESVELDSLRPWLGRPDTHGTHLANTYGIPETTGHASCFELTQSWLSERRNIVGRPLPQTQTYVLNESMQPVPVGVTGELYIGGAGLARGYLGAAALTAERFVPNPFAATPGERLYRSGELARVRPDGNRELLGRIDWQIELRGLRIKPTEIEAALLTHPLVRP